MLGKASPNEPHVVFVYMWPNIRLRQPSMLGLSHCGWMTACRNVLWHIIIIIIWFSATRFLVPLNDPAGVLTYCSPLRSDMQMSRCACPLIGPCGACLCVWLTAESWNVFLIQDEFQCGGACLLLLTFNPVCSVIKDQTFMWIGNVWEAGKIMMTSAL